MLGLGALTLAGCGAPAELDESRFPGLNETGYIDNFGPIGGVGNGGAGAPPSSAGAPGQSGAGNVPVGGTGNVGQGGSPPVAAGGSGSVSTGGNPPMGGQSGQQGGASQGGSDQTGGGSCPDDITVLFNRPGDQGGCDGMFCHRAGGQRPDMISPGVEERLLDVASNCMGIPYISAGESFLEEKLVGPPRCNGFVMPLGAPMPEEDRQCILDWIDEVSGG